jgi:hypothetical protein
MTNRRTNERQEDEPKQDFLEKRGFTWGALLVLLVVTLIAALVLAYLMTVHNIPTHWRGSFLLARSFREEHRQPIVYGIAAAAAGAEHRFLLEIFLLAMQERGMAYGTRKHA